MPRERDDCFRFRVIFRYEWSDDDIHYYNRDRPSPMHNRIGVGASFTCISSRAWFQTRTCSLVSGHEFIHSI